jgi:hypothetical protein
MNRWLHGLAGDRQFLIVIFVGKAKQVALIAAAIVVPIVGLWWLL